MPELARPRALDIFFVFATGGLLSGAAEGAAVFSLHGYRVPEFVWIIALLYMAVAFAACVIGWPLWRLRCGFVLGFAFVAAAVPYGFLLTRVDADYQGYLTWNQGRWLCIGLAAFFSATCTLWCVRERESAMRCARRLLVSVVILLVAWAGGMSLVRRTKPPAQLASASAPNVIVLVIDTTRADHLSAYGYSRKTTPNLERIASEGVLFQTAISASSWTLPSHASIVTGLYPHDHHTTGLQDTLPHNLPTLGEQFLARGYRTAGFSANTYFFGRENGFHRGFQTFEAILLSTGGAFQHTELGKWSNKYLFDHGWYQNIIGRQSAADINRAAMRWIDSDDRPFFLMLNYFDVHDPYILPAGAAGPWGHGLRVPAKRISESFNQFREPTPDELRYEMDQYDNCLLYADSQVAALTHELQVRDLDHNTMLVITSDHGEEFNDHGILTHANALYLEEIHVPLIIWFPGKVPAGMRIARPVSTINIGATVLDLAARASGGAASSFPGRSLAAFWTNGDVEHWPDPVSELARLPINPNFPNARGAMKSIVTDQWHYIYGPENTQSLYQCCANGVDGQNLATSSDSAPIMSGLRAELDNSAEPSSSASLRTASQPQQR